MNDHIKLPFYEGNFERKLRGGGSPPKQRDDRIKYAISQVNSLNQLQKEFDDSKYYFSDYFEPSLIFKIDVNQNIDEKSFRAFLREAKINIISPSPDNKGYWITLTEDENFEKLKQRLNIYKDQGKLQFFNAIESFSPIPPEEKIGKQLELKPLSKDEEAFLDIEIWRMEDEKLKKFLEGFKRLIREENGRVSDELTTDDICLLRVQINYDTLQKIIDAKEICLIDRPPKPYITYELLSTPLENFEIEGPPSSDSTAIAILDSGILSNHPLFQGSIGDEIAVPMLNSNQVVSGQPVDDVGHGTKVAGVALYGDIGKCIHDQIFKQEVIILSAKIMYRSENALGEVEALYDPEELLEHQLQKAIEYFVSNYPNCKVVNLSFGNKHNRMQRGRRQFPIANLIDHLAKEHRLIFVISAGNINEDDNGYPEDYPEYLIGDDDEVKIVDTASSAYALTVGSIAPEYGPLREADIYDSPCLTHYPSPFTSTGLGFNDMIKPELVEEGGNVIINLHNPHRRNDPAGNVIVLNPNWLSGSPHLFTFDRGTSFAAPKIANICARLFNKYPTYSSNTIKSLILSSSSIPEDRPRPLDEIGFDKSDEELSKLLKIYGYGKPNLEIASLSENNNVVLFAENKIGLNKVHLYYFYIPEEFITTAGSKEISVSLVYDPPVRLNRLDYLGVALEFHLFKNASLDDIIQSYRSIKIERESDDIVPSQIKYSEIKLKPGVNTRKRGIHQKGIISYTRQPDIVVDRPLVLAVLSQDKWINKDNYLQDYSVVVRIKHQAEIELYNLIQEQIQQKMQIEHRIRV